MASCLQPFINCLSCLFCDCLCCECNCLIFPAPSNTQFLRQNIRETNNPVSRVFLTFQADDKTIPYVEFTTPRSRQSKKCFIYFHGNAQDINLVGMFLQPLVQELDVTFYAIEYPSYSTYHVCCRAMLSNTIKQDSLLFYDHLLRSREQKDILVMGRSIGSGGASFLVGHRNVPLLILMSPFDTIKSVAMGLVGCLGCLVKQHFNNQDQLAHFTGELLIIHGQADEVIGIQHGRHLIERYEQRNAYKNVAVKHYPRRMSHNNFHMEEDILAPIKRFIQR